MNGKDKDTTKGGGDHGNDKKLKISVLIENDQIFSDEYLTNQKLEVIVNRTLAKLKITADGRELKREDGTPLTDLSLTIGAVGIHDGEVLRFFKKAVKPDRDKGFALNASSWHLKKNLKNFYTAEISILERGLGGIFELKSIVEAEKNIGRVGALGVLHYDGDKSQLIKIIFPTRYPYAPPRIIPIENLPNIQAIQFQQLPPKFFAKGNQYSDGSMCLLRSDQWNKNEHNIGWCLRRAQEWLKYAASASGFPKEKIVVEIPSHFQHTGQVILPKEYVPPDQKSGEITLTQFKPMHYILEDNLIPNHVFSLNLGKEIFKWYKLPSGVTLQALFPNNSGNAFAEAFKQHFGVNIVEGGNNQNVALYIPDDPNKWHFFKLQIQKMGTLANMNIAYFLARTVDKELYLRTHDIFDDQILGKKKVTVIGLGAIGSEVARSLARNGVGAFNFFDHDTFEIGNSVRHAADIFYIGENKASVAKQLVLRSNPNILVNAYNLNVLDDDGLVEDAISNSDICIVLTAEDQVDYLMNEYAVRSKIPFVFARVSSGGLSGSVQVVNPKSACLNCLRLAEADTLPTPKAKTNFDELPPEYGSCSTPAFPGSEVDTKEIALQVTRITLQLLLDGEKSNYAKLNGHQFYWHGPYGSAKQKPFTWEIKNIKKHTGCEICGKIN